MNKYPEEIGRALAKLRSARDALRSAFPDLSFALDGNLVGDIGEAIAISAFDLKKLRPGSKDHDFEDQEGQLIQVKTTQQTQPGKAVGLGLTKRSFDHLLVIQLLDDGYEILYNGPGKYVDAKRAHKQSAPLSVKQLTELNETVPPHERLP